VAVLWEADGPHVIDDLLTQQAVDLGGWKLWLATAVSADGQTIVGDGIAPDGTLTGWIAVVPRRDR